MTLATRKAVVTKTFTHILRPSAARAENVAGIITNFHFLPPFYSILIRFRLILEKSQSFSNHAGKRHCRNFETLDIISPGIWDLFRSLIRNSKSYIKNWTSSAAIQDNTSLRQ